jgi:PelA/Pel-15E family pectate lyase
MLNSLLSFRVLIAVLAILACTPSATAQLKRSEVVDSLHRAVTFFRQQASAQGGYVYRLSADLAKREGEGIVGPTTAWIEPPATPSVGMAYLVAYQQCGDRLLLAAAQETADALIRGQLESGGWDNRIEFDPGERKKYAYRVDAHSPADKKLRNTTTFDDNKSQSAITFLMRLDQELKFKDVQVHEAALYALDATLKAQYRNGAWPQRFDGTSDRTDSDPRQATLPDAWPRKFPGEKYESFYTLNDDTMSDLIVMMLDAAEIYGDKRYLDAALLAGDFLLLAQLPEPQPGWAQQYDKQMQPAWARKFEPPAVSGSESQGVMQTLLTLYRRTAVTISPEKAERFLASIPPAIAYYRRSELPDGRLARFYELKSNRPLYVTKSYELTYSPDDLPNHYGFIVGSKLDRIESELEKIRSTPSEQLWKPKAVKAAKKSAELADRTAAILADMDDRGAWVEAGKLSYHGDDDSTDRIIQSQTFAKHIVRLAEWLSANP